MKRPSRDSSLGPPAARGRATGFRSTRPNSAITRSQNMGPHCAWKSAVSGMIRPFVPSALDGNGRHVAFFEHGARRRRRSATAHPHSDTRRMSDGPVASLYSLQCLPSSEDQTATTDAPAKRSICRLRTAPASASRWSACCWGISNVPCLPSRLTVIFCRDRASSRLQIVDDCDGPVVLLKRRPRPSGSNGGDLPAVAQIPCRPFRLSRHVASTASADGGIPEISKCSPAPASVASAGQATAVALSVSAPPWAGRFHRR